MGMQENKDRTMSGYRMFKTGNIQGLIDLCTDDVEWTGPEVDSVPFSGTFRGQDGVAEFFAKMGKLVEAEQFEPQTFIAEGDQVAVTGISRWRTKATGVTYETPWVHVFTMRQGKIARFEHFSNTAAVEAALKRAPAVSTQADSTVRH